MKWLIVSLILWGICKGFYEANIFASVFDVIRPEARGTATGFMNMMGWLAGGGTAPIVVGYLADRIERDPAFGKALMDEAAILFLRNEPETARVIVRDLVGSHFRRDWRPFESGN